MSVYPKKGATTPRGKGGIDPSVNGENPRSTVSSVPHGTYHMADHPELYEPQRSNNFEFIVTDLSNLTRATDNTKIGSAQEILRMSVISTKIPHYSQSPISVRRGNSVLKYAGVPEFQEGSLVVNDFIGADTKSILMAWQNLSYNVKTEKVGLASEYKKDCYLIEYSPDMQKVRQWRLHGCWVSSITEDDYNAENNAKKSVSATIQYDRAEIDEYGSNEID